MVKDIVRARERIFAAKTEDALGDAVDGYFAAARRQTFDEALRAIEDVVMEAGGYSPEARVAIALVEARVRLAFHEDADDPPFVPDDDEDDLPELEYPRWDEAYHSDHTPFPPAA